MRPHFKIRTRRKKVDQGIPRGTLVCAIALLDPCSLARFEDREAVRKHVLEVFYAALGVTEEQRQWLGSPTKPPEDGE